MEMEKLKEVLIRSKLSFNKTAVIFIDLDQFKKVKYTLGHLISDEMLLEASQRIKACLGTRDSIFKLNGEEFIVTREDLQDSSCTHKLLDSLLQSFEEPFVRESLKFNVTLSMGVAVYPDHGTSMDELIKFSDLANYQAKGLGGNNYQIYHPSMSQQIMQRVRMENDLQGALSNKELFLVYQPLINFKNGETRGFEALIRWERDGFGQVSPLEFIPLAEETGLIIPIGEWVLRKACATVCYWNRLFDKQFTIAVNISVLQIKVNNFVQMVEQILIETGISPQLLELEITESMLIESFEDVLPILEQLKKLGIRLSLDDFGTGYSSLNYLIFLPIDNLKIDKSFINNILGNCAGRKIVDAIISLVHKLNLCVIAEGVETELQSEYLESRDCEVGQGYLFGKPIPEQEVSEQLRTIVKV